MATPSIQLFDRNSPLSFTPHTHSEVKPVCLPNAEFLFSLSSHHLQAARPSLSGPNNCRSILAVPVSTSAPQCSPHSRQGQPQPCMGEEKAVMFVAKAKGKPDSLRVTK